MTDTPRIPRETPAQDRVAELAADIEVTTQRIVWGSSVADLERIRHLWADGLYVSGDHRPHAVS